MHPRTSLSLAGALLLAGACAPAATLEPPAAPGTPAVTAAAEAPPPPAPTRVTAGAMPGDAHFYVELPAVPALVAAARGAIADAVYASGRAELAKETGLSEQFLERLLASIESMHLGGKHVENDVKAAVSVTFNDAEPFRELCARGIFTDAGAFGPYGRKLKAKDNPKDTFVWFEGPKLLALGDDPMLAAVAAVVEGRTPALTDAQRASVQVVAGERRIASGFVAPALLAEAALGQLAFPTPLTGAIGLLDAGLRGSYRATIASPKLAAAQHLPPPRALTLARRLPAETAGYVALSTGLPGGRDGAAKLIASLIEVTGREGEREVAGIENVLGIAGLRLVDVLGALGNEGVAAVSLRPAIKSQADLEKSAAIVLVLELADTQPAERLLKLAREKLSPQKKKLKVHAEGSGFSADISDKSFSFLRVKIAGGRFFLGAGQKDLVERAALAIEKGKGTLGDEGAHGRALAALPPTSQVRMWFDLGRAAELASALAPPGQQASLDLWRKLATGARRPTSGLSFTVTPEDDRVRLELDEINGVGIFAALGVYGVRAYLAKSKAAEARNTISAISRGAAAAFEREQLGPNNAVLHQLCKSAQPVPSVVPRGRKHQPSSQRGMDWNTGDDTTGWRCLKIELSEPQYYQYTYIVGGPYKGPTRGGPDPGPNGFEIAAEGDLDGNGVTSLYTRVGVVDPRSGTLKVSPELFVVNGEE